MPKHFIFLLFIFSSIFSKAHPILDGLEKAYQSTKHSDLTLYLDGLSDKSTQKIIYEYSKKIDREIIDGYFEFKVKIEQITRGEGNPSANHVDRYYVSIIRFENKVIHFKIEEEINKKNKSDKWVHSFQLIKEKTDSLKYEKLEMVYYNIYKADLKFRELFEDEIIYGSNCGLAGQDPPYREQLNYFILNKSKKDLKNWLVSATPELQLYAIDGILTFSKNGVRFEDETYALIEVIANKEGTVNSCSGCMHWKTTIKSEVEILLKKHGLTD